MNKPFIITVFGAESTGKTTLSRQLTAELNATWTEEFARPYLESTGGAITTASMRDIWHGQAKLQRRAVQRGGKYAVQDTDLFSTVGYWQLPHVEPVIGHCPTGLIREAAELQSDLYLITRSNIPFETDPIRYGGDKRESPDSYWISLCETYHLPYIVLAASDPAERLTEALGVIAERSQLCAV